MATRRLVLLRHAKSDWYSGAATDFDRPLNDRGRRDAPRVGRWLRLHALAPDVVCCSSAHRTRQTLDLVGTELGLSEADLHYLGELYHAGEREITGIVEDYLPVDGTLMVVGHNPGMETALLEYCPDVQVSADGKLMPTAAVAVLEWPETADPPQLRHLVSPRDL